MLLEELLFLLLLLLGVVGSYYALKLHYIFAFRLVEKGALSPEKKNKIEKIKPYWFTFLKFLFIALFIATSIFATLYILEGESLKALILGYWYQIPQGFWMRFLFTLLRIALLIVVMRFILKYIYRLLTLQEAKSVAKKRHNEHYINDFYSKIHTTIKYSVVLGILYRIIHFFPFLAEISLLFLGSLILFFVTSSGLTLRAFWIMKRSTV